MWQSPSLQHSSRHGLNVGGGGTTGLCGVGTGRGPVGTGTVGEGALGMVGEGALGNRVAVGIES